MFKTKKQTHIDSCLNCSQHIREEDSFCPRCGQRARRSQISIWSILAEFFSNVFNLDSRFFKSLRFIFLPSRLPKEYMEGKRRSYINPARFFFVTLVIHFAVLAYVTKNEDIIFDVGHEEQVSENMKRLERIKVAQTFDSLSLLYPLADQSNLDSLKHHLFKDTIRPNLGQVTYFGLDFNIEDSTTYKSISNYDLLVLEPDEVIEKYEIENYLYKFQIKQSEKLKNNPKAAFQFLLGNALWVIILLTISSAMFLKLLYIRHRFYLVDHLVVSMFYHSVILIILTIFYIPTFIFWEIESMSYLSYFLGLLIPLYGYLSLKRYYNQGSFKTLIKFILLGIFQMIMLTIFASLVVVVSVALF